MKTSTAIVVVGGMAIAAYLLLRPKTAPSGASTPTPAPSKPSGGGGSSVLGTIVSGLATVGAAAATAYFSKGAGSGGASPNNADASEKGPILGFTSIL